MTRTVGARAVFALASAAVAGPAVAASASAQQTASGGAAFEAPAVTRVECGTGASAGCPRGGLLRISGEALSHIEQVVFLGGRGARDDRRARPRHASPHRVTVQVPSSAKTGRLRLVASAVTTTGPRLRVLPAGAVARPAAGGGGVFPIQGKHDYGTETNRFGGGRSHGGQDVFAACGTPLVAARAGTVTLAKFQERAGNYVVITADDGTSQAYMHLLAPASVTKGQRVGAGQRIGQVGQTGRASGCHLHFELWTAPGWYQGGSAVDPLAALQGWDPQPR